jgi:cell fate (sporulation/competence/biofilm development) regulator YlbF (YheA/YmcA/DUF963 family)
MTEEIRELRWNELNTNVTEDFDDGSFLIRDVRLLATGVFTDSAVRLPTLYTAEVLEEYATNWVRKDVFNRHMGGAPRDISNTIGSVENLRFNGSDAIIGDIRLHALTQTSKDAIAMVKSKQITGVSVEHGGEQVYDSSTKNYKMNSLVFRGLAIVSTPACHSCVISLENGEDTVTEETQELTTVPTIEEFEALLDRVTKLEEMMNSEEPETEEVEEIEETEQELEEATESEEVHELEAEYTSKIDALEATIRELNEKIVELENTPAPVIKTSASVVKELAAPAFEIKTDKVSGSITRK